MVQRRRYRIRVQGRLRSSWSSRLGGMQIETTGSGEQAETTLTGEVADQSALSGVLNALVDLHLPVISVDRLGQDDGAASPTSAPGTNKRKDVGETGTS